MKSKLILGLAALTVAMPVFAERNFPSIGVGATAGTLGAGLTVTVPVLPVLNARLWGTGLGFDVDVDIDDSDGVPDNELEFDGDVTLGAVGGMLDYHPFANGLRFSLGVLYSLNKFDGDATCDVLACEVGGQPAVITQGDRLNGEVDYTGVAPYLGLGWGNAVDEDGRLTFSFDLGVMFTGSPDVTVRCSQVSGGAAPQALCDAQADQEEDDLEDEIGEFDVYPVLSIGLAYRF